MEVGLVSICNVESRCANICTKLCTCNLSVQTFIYFFLEENRCAERPFPKAEQVLTSCLLCQKVVVLGQIEDSDVCNLVVL